MKAMKFFLATMLIFSTSAVPLGLVACSRTTTTTTTVSDSPVETTRVEKTTTVESDTATGCGGILSCTVDTIGAVIALPFKAVGALLGAIF